MTAKLADMSVGDIIAEAIALYKRWHEVDKAGGNLILAERKKVFGIFPTQELELRRVSFPRRGEIQQE